MGIFIGALSGACFALGNVLARRGMRYRAGDNGLFMTVFVNVAVLGVVLAVASRITSLPPVNLAGLSAFLLAGVVGTGIGRGSGLAAVRLIGAARQSLFQTAVPLVTLLLSWLLLNERIGWLQGLGGIVVLAGLGVQVTQRMTAPALVAAAASPGSPDVPSPGAGVADPYRRRGYSLAALGTLAFGSAFVIRKFGIAAYPDALAGALWGSVASLAVIIARDAVSGRLRQVLTDNFRHASWWFVGAGFATGLALVCQILALNHLPAWTVSLLHGTQSLWVLLWSALLLGTEERVSARLIGALALVLTGVAMITLGA